MKYVLIGGGFTNAILALLIKDANEDADIFIIEKNNEILKKLSITGNGKCNILNKNIKNGLIIENKKIKSVFDSFSYEDLKVFYEELGLPLFEKGDYVYPFSESANQVKDFLKKCLDEAGINIILEEKVIDYKEKNNKYIVLTDKNTYSADYIVIATGGKSYPNLGADDSILTTLKNNHQYKVKKFKPGLCAIKVKENIKTLDGVRVRAKIKVLDKNVEVFSECGEVLFKKDALSGIVIFNASLFISKNYNDYSSLKIVIDLLEGISANNPELLEKYTGSAEFLNAYLGKKLANYIDNMCNNDISLAFEITKNLKFSVTSLYSFEYAQISVGGIALENINEDLESKHEKNVFFGGEILDISGYCGGYNLSACLISAAIIWNKICLDVSNYIEL